VPWKSDELERIAAAEELQIASVRGDGTLRRPTTIWVVRDRDDLYVRSVNGPDAGWFRGTQVRHEGRISAGGVDKDVSFVAAGEDAADEIDSAYGEKYSRYPESYIAGVTTPQARSTTLRLVPH
jgi:hypothetical protein